MTRTQASQSGLAQWRQAAMQRRGMALVAVVRVAPAPPPAASRPYASDALKCPASSKATIQIGEFVISPEGDPRILGHPQIRY